MPSARMARGRLGSDVELWSEPVGEVCRVRVACPACTWTTTAPADDPQLMIDVHGHWHPMHDAAVDLLTPEPTGAAP